MISVQIPFLCDYYLSCDYKTEITNHLQIMFCGGAGFVEDFVRPNVLEMMLDWQREDGCYAPYDGSHLPDAIALHNKKSRERLEFLDFSQRKHRVMYYGHNL